MNTKSVERAIEIRRHCHSCTVRMLIGWWHGSVSRIPEWRATCRDYLRRSHCSIALGVGMAKKNKKKKKKQPLEAGQQDRTHPILSNSSRLPLDSSWWQNHAIRSSVSWWRIPSLDWHCTASCGRTIVGCHLVSMDETKWYHWNLLGRCFDSSSCFALRCVALLCCCACLYVRARSNPSLKWEACTTVCRPSPGITLPCVWHHFDRRMGLVGKGPTIQHVQFRQTWSWESEKFSFVDRVNVTNENFPVLPNTIDD